MSKRRKTSDNYSMEVTAKDDCPKCFGTGIAIEQEAKAYMRSIEIILSVCMCVRVLPRLKYDPDTRTDPFAPPEAS